MNVAAVIRIAKHLGLLLKFKSFFCLFVFLQWFEDNFTMALGLPEISF